MSCFHITIFYPYRGGITYFKCTEINKVSLSKLQVSFELAHVFAGPGVLVFGNQNMVTLSKWSLLYCMKMTSNTVSRHLTQVPWKNYKDCSMCQHQCLSQNKFQNPSKGSGLKVF